ncbi:MAG: pentapeptide repeat-containing protein [Solobacterium sp.]|jgi:uncharacterized protein YjbI with pentapeptide repeats|nr:pentapeptide repeat-containing protein [Solobacterium sp.]MCH4206437.1 pentapeptide repeat-containing protein [Solobacterium sp.]MCH4227952.1 pentapeptide repeat-containing protein [Solobacterium sp.]MCH4283362.1 pentapeptide repeat-containing protein [Solobacterium sp.]
MKKISAPSFSEECLPAELKREKAEKRTDNCSFSDEECSKDLTLHEFFECTFAKIIFLGKMDKMEFADVIFDHCDFSNISMQECCFRRVQFLHCRLTGCDMSGSSLTDTEMKECQGEYLNLNCTGLNDCSWQETLFKEASFAMMKIKHLEIKGCNFTRSEWADTKMKDLDLSDSIIDGIAVNAENLKGVIVNAEQAVVMAKLLGIRVRS